MLIETKTRLQQIYSNYVTTCIITHPMDPDILFLSQKATRKYAYYAGQHFWKLGQAACQLHTMLASRLQSAGKRLADYTFPRVPTQTAD